MVMALLQSRRGQTPEMFPVSLVEDWRAEACRLEEFFRRQLTLLSWFSTVACRVLATE